MEGSEEDKFNFKRPKNRHQHDDFSKFNVIKTRPGITRQVLG